MRRAALVGVLIILMGTLLFWLPAFAIHHSLPRLGEGLPWMKAAGVFSARVQEENWPCSPLEATSVTVMSQVSGRVLEVTVGEGEAVQAGQLLIRLDDTLLARQSAAAQAGIQLARAQVTSLKAQPLAEAVDVARGQVSVAQASVALAKQGWEDAKVLRDTPQDVEPDIVKAETALDRAQFLEEAALAQAQAADLTMKLWERTVKHLQEGVDIPLPNGDVRHVSTPQDKLDEASFQWNIASQKAWQGWAAYQQAKAGVEAAQIVVRATQAQVDDPARDIPVAQAFAAYEEAKGALQVAQAELEALQIGVSPDKITAAAANEAQARAVYQRLEAQRQFYTITAPAGGLVTERAIEPGEVAMPGVTLLEIADLKTLHLKVYVPESDLGKVRVGQVVDVSVDAFPGRVFSGQVVRVADKAEFTPKNVQAKEDRMTLVYAVEVDLPNRDGLLKPGMPADAIIRIEAGAGK